MTSLLHYGLTARGLTARTVTPQGRYAGYSRRAGFTLIELLVVVLIIGILAAVALPQYQKAVLKSRYMAIMPLAKTIVQSNESYYLEYGEYADDPAELSVSSDTQNEEVLLNLNPSADYSYVQVTRDDLPGLRHVVYQKHSINYAGDTHCEAADEQAQQVCLAVGGQLLGNRAGYTVYRLSGNGTGEFPYKVISSSGSYGPPNWVAVYANGSETVRVDMWYPGFSIRVYGTFYYTPASASYAGSGPTWRELCEQYPFVPVCD